MVYPSDSVAADYQRGSIFGFSQLQEENLYDIWRRYASVSVVGDLS